MRYEKLKLHEAVPPQKGFSSFSAAFPELNVESSQIPYGYCNQFAQILESGKISWRGKTRFLPPVLIRERARNSYFYIQLFFYFEAVKELSIELSPSDTWMVLYTYQGSVTVSFNQQNYLLNDMSGIWLPCDIPLNIHADRFWEGCILFVNGPAVPSLYIDYLSADSFTFRDDRLRHFEKISQDMLDEFSKDQALHDVFSSERLHHLISYLIWENTESFKIRKGKNDSIAALIDYMQAHLSSNITIEKLSELSSISPYHLIREFKKTTSFSPIDFLLRLRINEAKSLLQHTSMPIKQISSSVGIEDEKYFSRLFRKRTGQSPKQYRNSFNKHL